MNDINVKRRHFLLAPLLFGVSTFHVSAGVLFEDFFNKSWSVPRSIILEIWPTCFGMKLQEILNAIADWIIPTSSRIVIRLEDGKHFQSRAVDITHYYGNRLSIVGNVENPERCQLIWSGPSEGFYVGAGAVLGFINGFNLKHDTVSSRGLGSAFLADEGGVIHCGSSLEVCNFYYGFQARFGGVIACGGVVSRGAGDANFFAFNGGHISCPKAKAFDADDRTKKLGFGFMAEYGGTINAIGAIAENNSIAGFAALSNGVIRAYDSQTKHNGYGYYTNTGGTIIAHNAIAHETCGFGVLALNRSTEVPRLNYSQEKGSCSKSGS
jgi:hypothetical protein